VPYLQDLGATGRETRVGSLINYILRHRGLGKSDESIRATLAKSSGLDPTTHPCADIDGYSVCEAAEIEEAFARAPAVKTARVEADEERKDKKAKSALMQPKNLAIIGGAAAVAYFISKRHLLLSLLGAGGAAYFLYQKERK